MTSDKPLFQSEQDCKVFVESRMGDHLTPRIAAYALPGGVL
jgi:hypothetical protein